MAPVPPDEAILFNMFCDNCDTRSWIRSDDPKVRLLLIGTDIRMPIACPTAGCNTFYVFRVEREVYADIAGNFEVIRLPEGEDRSDAPDITLDECLEFHNKLFNRKT